MTRLPSLDLPELPLLPGQRRKQQSNPMDMSQEEEDSIVRKVGRTAVGGISAAGNLLDLPGSMIRDVLTLNNPLDQLAHPFSDVNRTSGRDMLRQWGFADRKDTFGNFLGGLAADVVTDPLTWIFPFGKATKAGSLLKDANLADNVMSVAAKKLGKPVEQLGKRQSMLKTTIQDVLDSMEPQKAYESLFKLQDMAAKKGVNLNDIVDDPLWGAFGTGFMGNAKNVMGFGATAEKYAAKLDKYGNALRYATIPGTDIKPVNAMMSLFDAPAAGTRTRTMQEFARQAFHGKTGARAEAMKEIGGYIDELRQAGHATDAEAQELRSMLEGTFTGPMTQNMDSLVQKLQDRQIGLLNESAQWGTNPRKWESPFAKYWPRFATDRIGKTGGGGKGESIFSTFTQMRKKRMNILQPFEDSDGVIHAIEGETSTIQKLLKDPNLDNLINSGADKQQIAEFIKNNYGAQIPEKYGFVSNGKKLTGDRHKALANWIAGMDPELRKAGMFDNHPIIDFQAALISHKEAIESAKAMRDALTSPGVLQDAATTLADRSVQSLSSVMRRLGLKAGNAEQGFARKLIEQYDPQLAASLDTLIGAGKTKEANRMMVDFIKSKAVSGDIAGDMGRYADSFTKPRAVGELMKAVQSVTNMFKGAVTGVWPAFHTRNFVSGQYQNWVAGMWSKDSVHETYKLLKGDAIQGASNWKIIRDEAARMGISNLTDQQATDILGQMIYSQGLSNRFAGEVMATAGGGNLLPSGIEEAMREIPGMGVNHIQPGRIWRKAVAKEPGTNWKFWRTRGVNDLPVSEFGPMAAGEEVGGIVESFNRIAPFIQQIKKGVDPTAAARKVGAAQVMYQGRYFTNFERQAMATAFPFYKFSSRMMPWTLRQLADAPGGKLAQTIRLANAGKNPSVMAPDYVSETMAIPMGASPDGTQRYLTGAGLMFEDPLSFFGSGPRGMLQEVGSRLNPLIKAPIEWATGQSLFQKGPQGGRPLEDMDPTIGRTLANLTGQKDAVKFPGSDALEFLVGNSPFSRLASTARASTYPIRTLWDPEMQGQFLPESARTAANLLTGFRVTGVSPAAQDALLRERTQQLMRKAGGKTFVRSYIPKDVEEQMSPQELIDAQRLEAMMNVLAKRTKERVEKRKAEEAKKKR